MKKDDKARVRVFFGEIEGDNETIKDGLRSIAEAVKQTFKQEQKTVKVIAASPNIDPKQLAGLEQVIDIEALDQEEDEAVNTAEPVTNGAKPRSARAKKPVNYPLVKDLNFYPSGKQSLQDFFKEKAPSGIQQKLTAAVYYLDRILEIKEITPSHVVTVLKEVGVRVPSDVAQSMRNVANKKAFIDTSATNAIKITVKGENFIEHDLPGAKAEQVRE
jgi:hypothetical protein